MIIKNTLYLGAALVSTLCYALPDSHTNDQVNAPIQAGTFKNPSSNVRPRFRYWIPDASADLSWVEKDIEGAAAAGAGGVELLGYYQYGANPGDFVPVDWSQYGWGTPSWKKLFDTAIQAHAKHGLVMDFAMGPNQGQGVPAHEEDEGLMWDLHLNQASIPLNGSHSFNGTIPGWGSGKLEALITAIAIKSAPASGSAPGLPNSPGSDRTQVTLSAKSLEDITAKVSENGRLDINFGSDKPEDGVERLILAVYLYKLPFKNQAQPQSLKGPQTPPQSFVQNGSWIVDHFSARGAKVITDFWENYLLVNGTKEALMKVGNYAWEDSVEINPDLYWTPNLPEKFEKQHGYSINKWYPLMFHQNSLFEHFSTWYITDEADSGNSHISDYRNTLTTCNGEYLDALTKWANDYLGVQFSAQVGYNMAVDMQSIIPQVNAPECECLAFFNSIDAYRQYSAPANMAGKRVISTECGAVGSVTYQQTLPELIWAFRRSLAGSVNNIVIHGLPYSGDYPNTTWPGFTTFTYAFSEMHGRHQPGWDFYSDSLDYIARLQYLFQSGVPKLDVAFYQKLTSYHNTPRSYGPTDLEAVGYSYGYLNPDNLALPAAQVKNGILAPDLQAYKALIIRASDTMTVLGVKRIAELAKQGLPIIFVGGMPSYLGSYDPDGEEYMRETLASIKDLNNVHHVAIDGLAASISSLGITPLTKLQANGSTWYTYWRRSEALAEDYIFVYNDSPESAIKTPGFSQGTVEFQSTGQPYLFDAWSGETTRILNYTQTKTTTKISLLLASNQAVIVVFKNKEKPKPHAIAVSDNVLAVVDAGNGLAAHIGYGTNNSSITTSDNKLHSLKSASKGPFELRNWKLTVEHWDPPVPITEPAVDAVKYNTTHQIDTLKSWQQIPGLEKTSGRGYYETTFDWPPANDISGAIISFGPIVHTIHVIINGKTILPLDTTSATGDISKYLTRGTNKIQVVVTTTLANVLAPIWESLRVSGVPPTGAFGSPTKPSKPSNYGLLYAAVITPYTIARI